MKLCIIGDSWASNAERSCSYLELNHILDRYSCKYINVSAAGASNFGQLQILKYQILENYKNDFDYIVWVHTEPARDFTEFISLDYGPIKDDHFSDISLTKFYQDIEYINRQNYNFAQQLFLKFNIPFFIIGGAGPLPDYVNEYSCFSKKIKSWNQEICEFKKMPENCYTHHLIKMIDYGRYTPTEVYEELAAVDKLEKFMRRRLDLYPDGAHPNKVFYQNLVERILN